MTHADKVAANRLAGGRLDGLAIGEDEGYAVQEAANAALAGKLGAIAGHKIGATAEGMRKLLNVPGPIAGDVFASTVHEKRATLRLADYVRPGLETEIAVRIGRDLTPDEPPGRRSASPPRSRPSCRPSRSSTTATPISPRPGPAPSSPTTPSTPATSSAPKPPTGRASPSTASPPAP
ncbi:MAG: hypothetical protein R3C69_02915 [Geminicoccaceae bacterium]